MIYTKEQILDELKKDYQLLTEDIGEGNIFGIFVKGSYNYKGLQDEYSDLDTVAIIFKPCQKGEFYSERKNITIPRKGEIILINIKDFHTFILQGDFVLFDETLFSQYYYINPEYKDYFQQLVDIREQLVNSRPRLLSLVYLFSIQDTLDRINLIKGIEELRYNTCKALSHIIREKYTLEYWMNSYPNGSFKVAVSLDFLSEEQRQYILDVKRGKIYWNPEEIASAGVSLIREIEQICKDFRDKVTDDVDTDTLQKTRTICDNILKKYSYSTFLKRI